MQRHKPIDPAGLASLWRSSSTGSRGFRRHSFYPRPPAAAPVSGTFRPVAGNGRSSSCERAVRAAFRIVEGMLRVVDASASGESRRAGTLVAMGRKSRFRRERVVNTAGAYGRAPTTGGGPSTGWLFIGELFGSVGGTVIGRILGKIVDACFRFFHH